MLRIVYGYEVDQHAELMKEVYKFRHRIFVEERGWTDLGQASGEEIDEFDTEHTIHQILLNDEMRIIGYQRLIPTTRPHLLSTVLSHLCHDPAPAGPDVLEWTRFAIEPSRRQTFPRRSSAFLDLAQGVVEWGLANDIRKTTVVIDCRLVVIGMQLRFRVRPLGFPIKIGREEVVALEFTFDEETLDVIHVARGSTTPIIAPHDLFPSLVHAGHG